MIVQERYNDYVLADNEITGMVIIGAATRAQTSVAFHRGSMRAVNAGITSLRSEMNASRREVDVHMGGLISVPVRKYVFGDNMDAALRAWRDIAVSDGNAESFEKHNQLIYILDKINQDAAERSGIAVDPEHDTYYALVAITRDIPRLMDAMGRVRAISTENAQNPKESNLELHYELGAAEDLRDKYYEDTVSGLERMLRNFKGSPSMKIRLAEMIERIKSHVYKAKKISINADSDPSFIFRAHSKQISSLRIELEENLSPIASEMLYERSSLAITALSLALLATLAGVFISALIARGIINASKETERIANAKMEFLSIISHEMRTPLNAVISYCSALAIDKSLPFQAENKARQADASAQLLLSLVNDLLDSAKFSQSGRIEVTPKRFNIDSVLNNALAAAAPRIHSKKLKLSISMDPDFPAWIISDPDRIQQIIVNFLTNASKFTEKGHITIEAGLNAGKMTFSVKDSGIGIPAHRLKSIFTPFSEANASVQQRYGGTGLGLSICFRIAEAIGGEISVQSIEGKGSTFTLTLLPQQPERFLFPQGGLLIPDDGPLRDWVIQNLPEESYEFIFEPILSVPRGKIIVIDRLNLHLVKSILDSNPRSPGIFLFNETHEDTSNFILSFPGPGIISRHAFLSAWELTWKEIDKPLLHGKALIVDDLDINRQILSEICVSCGIEPYEAASGQRALEMLSSSPRDFGLVLMDLRMPGLFDGLSASQEIHKFFDEVDLPKPSIWIVSANADDPRISLLSSGKNPVISGTIHKPISRDTIIQLLLKSFPSAHKLERVMEKFIDQSSFPLEILPSYCDPVLAWNNLSGNEILLSTGIARTYSLCIEALVPNTSNETLKSIAHKVVSAAGMIAATPLSKAAAIYDKTNSSQKAFLHEASIFISSDFFFRDRPSISNQNEPTAQQAPPDESLPPLDIDKIRHLLLLAEQFDSSLSDEILLSFPGDCRLTEVLAFSDDYDFLSAKECLSRILLTTKG